MSRSRASCWQHPDGRTTTREVLAAVVAANATVVGEGGVEIYSTMQMNVEIDPPALKKNEKLLVQLLEIDSRGGIFCQTDVVAALKTGMQGMAFNCVSADGTKDLDEAMQICSYMIRVMLSHLRTSYDNASCHESHVLSNLFKHMKSSTTSAQNSDAKRLRREERLKTRPNPFIHFRDTIASTTTDAAPMPEEEVMVTCYYDAPNLRSVMLMSDGSTQTADLYNRGANGFITCHWLKPVHCFENSAG